MSKAIYGTIVLLVATSLWGSSFVFIKLSVEEVSGFSYVFYRALISFTVLTPAIIWKALRKRVSLTSIVGGFVTGIAYLLGLLLQGIGTAYTTPSISAFITGLNTVHVHVYAALVKRSYSAMLLLSLVLAVAGLYMVTQPVGGLGFGELLVFLGSIAWAAEIILVSKYAVKGVERLEFLYGLLVPSLFLAPYVLVVEGCIELSTSTWFYIAYLAVVCTLLATFLQVVGQKHVSEATAAIIYILEPVFALLFSIAIYGESVTFIGLLGGLAMVTASAIAVADEVLRQRKPTFIKSLEPRYSD